MEKKKKVLLPFNLSTYRVPIPISFSTNFPITNSGGRSFVCKLEIDFKVGDILVDVVKNTFLKTSLPKYLQEGVISEAYSAVYEKVLDKSSEMSVSFGGGSKGDKGTSKFIMSSKHARKTMEFHKIYGQVFNSKSKTDLVSIEQDMNRLFVSKMMDVQREYFDFSKIPAKVLKELFDMRRKQRDEFENIIRDIYSKMEPAGPSSGNDLSNDLIFEKLRQTFAEMNSESSGEKFDFLKGRAYQIFEVFTNEKLLTHYSYYTQRTVKLILLFEDDVAKLLCEYRSDEKAHRMANLTDIYRDNLNAVVCTCHAVYDRKKCVGVKYYSTELTKCAFCTKYSLAPELHFPQLEEQIYAVLNEINAANLVPVENGSFFLTKHSNVANMNVLFHMVVSKEIVSESLRRMSYDGLSQIFNLCCFSFNNVFVSLPLFRSNKPTTTTTTKTPRRSMSMEGGGGESTTRKKKKNKKSFNDEYYFEEFSRTVECFRNGMKRYDRVDSVENVRLRSAYIIVPSRLYNNEKFKKHCNDVVTKFFKVKLERKQKIVIKDYFT